MNNMGKQQKIKAIRKGEKAKVEDYKQRRDAFRLEITAASEKYKIDLVGGLRYGDTALVPMLVFVDRKADYEHITDEAREQNAKEAAAKPNGVVKPENSPKLEV